MIFKSGVVPAFVGWKIRVAFWCADLASWEVLDRPALVTSIREGIHSRPDSKHYLRDVEAFIVEKLILAPAPIARAAALIDPPGSHGAFDLRTWPGLRVPGQIGPAKREAYRANLDWRLESYFPGEFDIVAEATHVHTEHDPD